MRVRIAPRTFFLLIPHFTQKLASTPRALIRIAPRTFFLLIPHFTQKLASTPRALIRIPLRTFFLLIPHFSHETDEYPKGTYSNRAEDIFILTPTFHAEISEYPKGNCSHPTEIKFQPRSKHINLGRFCLNLVNAPHPFHQLLHGRASGPSSSVIHQRGSRSNSTTIQPDLHHTPTAINIQPQPLTVSRETFTDLTHL